MAILTGLMLKHTIMRGEASPFVMELPVYHVPHLKSLIIQTWQRLKGFVLRAGKVIVVVSIFLSALNSFTLSGRAADNINDSAPPPSAGSLRRSSNRLAFRKTTGRQPWACSPARWQRGGCRHPEHALHRGKHPEEEFNPAAFNLGDELLGAVEETGRA